jgi:hypothetical protein
MPKRRKKSKSKGLLPSILKYKIKLKHILILLFVIFIVFPFTLGFLGLGIIGEPASFQTASKIEMIENILKEYRATHTYSKPDFFVCADMSIDVWNMVKSKGINAQIYVGNIENPNANFTEFNHAWVVAELEPFTWLALETTSGRVVYKTENGNYYRGYSFDNPNEFKRFMELRRDFDNQVDRIKAVSNEAIACASDYEEMRIAFNEKYIGKPLTNEVVEARDKVAQKLGECNSLNTDLTEQSQVLTNIANEMKGLLT